MAKVNAFFDTIFNDEKNFLTKLFNEIRKNNAIFEEEVAKAIEKYNQEKYGITNSTIRISPKILEQCDDRTRTISTEVLDCILHLVLIILVFNLIIILIIYLYMCLYNYRYNIMYIYICVLQYLMLILRYIVGFLKIIKINYITKFVNFLNKKYYFIIYYYFNSLIFFFLKLIKKLKNYIFLKMEICDKNIKKKSHTNTNINKKINKNMKKKNYKAKVFLNSFYWNRLLKTEMISDRYRFFIDRFFQVVHIINYFIIILFYIFVISISTVGIIVLVYLYFCLFSNTDVSIGYKIFCDNLVNGGFNKLKTLYLLDGIIIILMIIKILELLNIYKNIKLIYLTYNFYILYLIFFVIDFFFKALKTEFIIIDLYVYIQIFLVNYFFICLYVFEKFLFDRKLLYDSVYFLSKILFFILFSFFLFIVPVMLTLHVKLHLIAILVMIGIANTVFIILF
jgi:hypothetical protein